MKWPLGLPICLLSQFSQLALPDVTIQALLFLTIQRYTQLRYPMVTCERLNACNLFKLGLLWSLSSIFWCVCLAVLISRGTIYILKLDISSFEKIINFYRINKKGFLDMNVCNLEYPNLTFVLVKETLTSVVPLVAIVFLNAHSIVYLYNKKYRLLSRTRAYRFIYLWKLLMTFHLRILQVVKRSEKKKDFRFH